MAWPTHHFDMTCDRTGTEHTVSVGFPVRYGSLDRVPLLLCLDGPWLFGTVLDATRIMSMSGEAPEAAVVGTLREQGFNVSAAEDRDWPGTAAAAVDKWTCTTTYTVRWRKDAAGAVVAVEADVSAPLGDGPGDL